jgi:DNA-binding NarL/FixJ family response regulator
MNLTIGIADDHQLFLKSLSALLTDFPGIEVILEALDGEDLLRRLGAAPVKPDILLIDVNMPVLDGAKAAERINREYPAIKLVALSMKEDDTSVIRMLKAGCCAYLLKDIHPDELEKALREIHVKGYYNADSFNVNYRRLITKANEGGPRPTASGISSNSPAATSPIRRSPPRCTSRKGPLTATANLCSES